MPAEQEKPVIYDEQINLTVAKEQKRVLQIAKIGHGIDATARIRAMISLWESDEKLRSKTDREARRMR